jgi:hypothetical protein
MSKISALDDLCFDLVARTAQPYEGTREGLARFDRYKDALLNFMGNGFNRDPQIDERIFGLDKSVSS